jgi:Pyruvate/2-oxoacid:ferredoxin oxidoreductase delta subunit
VQVVQMSSIRLGYFTPAPAAIERHEPVRTRIHNFDETNLGIPDPKEAERCFSCGHCTRCDTCLVYCPEGVIQRMAGADGSNYLVNLEYCKGCGICAAECPRGAMEMHPQ